MNHVPSCRTVSGAATGEVPTKQRSSSIRRGELLIWQSGHADIQIQPVADFFEPGFPALPGQTRRHDDPSNHGEERNAAGGCRRRLRIDGFDTDTLFREVVSDFVDDPLVIGPLDLDPVREPAG